MSEPKGPYTFTTSDYSLHRMREVMRKAKADRDAYEKQRDKNFKNTRDDGNGVWAWNRGHGEEWVIADDCYEQVKAGMPKADPVMGNTTSFGVGVRLWKLSDALAAGFWPKQSEYGDAMQSTTKFFNPYRTNAEFPPPGMVERS